MTEGICYRRGYNGVKLKGTQSSGGCRPTLTQMERAETARGWLSFRVTTVTSPQAVSPMMVVPSSLQAKCSCQRCWRGLNSTTSSPDSGSAACVLARLYPLQEAQARHKLSAVVGPPLARGMIWSISHGRPLSHSEVRQYSQRLWARARTNRRKAPEILSGGIDCPGVCTEPRPELRRRAVKVFGFSR
jgi:hypothetical protein